MQIFYCRYITPPPPPPPVIAGGTSFQIVRTRRSHSILYPHPIHRPVPQGLPKPQGKKTGKSNFQKSRIRKRKEKRDLNMLDPESKISLFLFFLSPLHLLPEGPPARSPPGPVCRCLGINFAKSQKKYNPHTYTFPPSVVGSVVVRVKPQLAHRSKAPPPPPGPFGVCPRGIPFPHPTHFTQGPNPEDSRLPSLHTQAARRLPR